LAILASGFLIKILILEIFNGFTRDVHRFKEQAGIVAYNQEEAIRTFTKLLPKKADRIEAFEIANSIATADMELDQKEQDLLAEIQGTFKF
jgi:hypothetical protein